LRDGSGQKRQRAAAVQNLAEIPSGPANAKRLGLRQPTGALERGNVNSGCRRGNGPRRNQMDVPVARVSSPAAASPDLAARDSLDADWTVHALRLGQPRSECRRRNGSRRNQMDD